MERFNALGRGMQIMLVGGVLLVIDLFLPWQDFDLGGIADEFGVDATFSGWRGFAGVVLGLLTIVLIAWIGVRIAGIDIPLPVSAAMTAALLGGLILAFAIIKMLSILGDEQTIWSYVGVILAAAIAFGAWQTVQAAGGMETLKTEMPTRATSSTMQTAPPVESASPPPPPAAPESEAAPAPAESPPMSEPEPYERPSDDPDTRRDA
ncbi:MAG: hypothetical protein WD380_09970 [Gaiellaceae bacterium]